MMFFLQKKQGQWLAKIRKKIEEERGPEEELPYWKQKDIFGGEKKIGQKKSKDKRDQKPPKPEIEKNQNKNLNDGTRPEIDDTEPQPDFEELSNDLPDGFTKI